MSYSPFYNSDKKPMPTRLMFLAVLSALTLAGCGIKGDLKTPPPLWGADKPVSETDTNSSEKDEDSVLNENALEKNDESNLYEERVDDPFGEAPN